ncbi:MAG: SDR family oxidoreductase, partial [Clostridia bacterium]|nr:SDR family oxidoreductase [Clostridia bacterium]
EVGPSGIRVNCIAPGVIDTKMNAMHSEETMAGLAEDTPLGRLGTPEDEANVAVFLAGPRASFMTGQVLGVNGGLVI